MILLFCFVLGRDIRLSLQTIPDGFDLLPGLLQLALYPGLAGDVYKRQPLYWARASTSLCLKVRIIMPS